MTNVRVTRRLRAPLVSLLLSSCFCATSALAKDEATTEADPAADAGSSEAPDEPSPETVKRAASHFERGLQLYNDAEYRLALIEFERAYQLVPNFRVQYNIAQVSIQIGRYARAVHALENYLEQGGEQISPERRAQVESDLKMLAGRTARVSITANVEGAEILLDDSVVATAPLADKLLIDAGEHRLTVRLRGYQPRSEQVTLAGGDDVELAFELVPVKKEEPVVIVKEVEKGGPADAGIREDEFPYATVGWIATGTFAAGAVVSGIVGLTAKDELDSLSQPQLDQDPEQVARERDAAKKKARSWFIASDVLTGAAIVTGAASLYLTLSTPEWSLDSEQDSGKDSLKVRAGAGINHVWVEGRF